ncbi:hypothetical protein GCM10011611_26930 [Aliidongia dinghuensis]|uniref:Putative Flp pilus-assembly TadG-like N-terminal domain-containing protein n=1 Tax=Aliidongia dinghuensis TaxID=1867774 RepID=A0A8J2YTH9_9PROT|nr:pilus assembly protein TadG-related protein [Aliidongia dinghuensis]GGF19596.1 hypothetical protein GCM10011611_26930 [Aliidongia dinghuensis]
MAARAPAREALTRVVAETRGSVAVLTAICLPLLLMLVGLAVELTNWTAIRRELQRTADLAALAGTAQFAAANASNAAANAAASLAELNGVTGAASRTWNASTATLTDNDITVTIGGGIRNAADTLVTVTVTETVPLILTKLLTSAASVTVSATSAAEYMSVPACILALKTSSTGITGQGNPDLSLTGCSLRSNSNISAGGSAIISAPYLFANGTITGSGIDGSAYPNSGTIADPYASNAAIQAAFSQVASSSGPSFSDSPKGVDTLSPGSYSSWNIKGTVTLDPGIYYVNGSISFGSQASVSGNGVTIVTSGSVSGTGGASLSLSAATTADATNGAIPGIVFAGNSTASSSLSGNNSPSITGVVYYPNGTLFFQGDAQGGSSGCLQVVAAAITLSGNSQMATNCSAYGTPIFGDRSPLIGLVR